MVYANRIESGFCAGGIENDCVLVELNIAVEVNSVFSFCKDINNWICHLLKCGYTKSIENISFFLISSNANCCRTMLTTGLKVALCLAMCRWSI